MPAVAVVRSALGKGGHQYLTFLSEEECGYLEDYLEERMRSGEKISSISPIVTPKMRMKPFVRAINVGDMIRKAIRKAGFKWRAYVLRSYFDTQLMLAESKGLVFARAVSGCRSLSLSGKGVGASAIYWKSIRFRREAFPLIYRRI